MEGKNSPSLFSNYYFLVETYSEITIPAGGLEFSNSECNDRKKKFILEWKREYILLRTLINIFYTKFYAAINMIFLTFLTATPWRFVGSVSVQYPDMTFF
jgi:hypothetical protein